MGFTSGNGRSHLICTAAITCALLCFAFMATGTASAATFKSVSGEVVIEAETYTRLGGNLGGAWFKNDEKKGYKGTGYIQSTLKDPKTLQYKSGNIRAEYDIDFKETGTYYLHLRTFAQNHTENGFFATMDGVQFDYGNKHAYFVYVKKKKSGAWFWYTDGGGAETRGYKVSIEIRKPGVHTLAICRRDKGTRVDRIWLTKKQSAPQNSGTLSLTDPAKFIAGGGGGGGGGSPTPPPPPPPPGGGTQISLEAKKFGANIERGDHAWVSASRGGVSAMEASPDSGTRIARKYAQNSPYLSYNVNFAKTGKYYVWLRGFCTGKDNSAHVGLNGRAVKSAKNISLPVEKNWVWSGTTGAGRRATVTVDKTGSQTIEVYMREDGLLLDKIILTTSAGFTP